MFSLRRQPDVFYEPKEDITTYELACVLPILIGVWGGTNINAVRTIKSLEPITQRHFRIVEKT